MSSTESASLPTRRSLAETRKKKNSTDPSRVVFVFFFYFFGYEEKIALLRSNDITRATGEIVREIEKNDLYARDATRRETPYSGSGFNWLGTARLESKLVFALQNAQTSDSVVEW